MKWRTALFEACEEVEMSGGEVRIVFIKRGDKRIPIITKFQDNKVFCDEETIIDED